MSFGRLVYDGRLASGLTKQELSIKLGISEGILSDIELSVTLPPKRMVNTFIRILKLNQHYARKRFKEDNLARYLSHD